MHGVGGKLSLKQMSNTSYHPICAELVKKFNGTVNSMLKKLCEDRPKDWDHYLGLLLFVYKEVCHGTVGFFPFEQLHGRSIYGLLAILKELWHLWIQEGRIWPIYSQVCRSRQLTGGSLFDMGREP